MTKKDFSIIVGVAFLLFALSGCRRSDIQTAQAEAPQEKAVSVLTYEVRPDTISRYIKLTGGLEAGNETLVYSQSTEKLEQIKVKIGQQVKANQVLAIQSGRALQQSVKQAEAAFQSVMAQEELAKKNHTRNEQLFQEQIISKQVFDQTATALKTAKLAVAEAQARLAQTQEQQGDTVIKAPFAGKVAQIFFHEGDMVSSGQAVFKIVNTGTFKAKLNVPETEATYISLAQPVIATFPAIPDAKFVGSITRIDEAIDPNKRSLEIEVSFVNPSADTEQAQSDAAGNPGQAQGNLASLKSGQFGQFKLEVERHEQTVSIPDNALMTQTGVKVNELGEQITFKTYYVYVVEQGKAVMKTVTPGIYSSGRVELTSGVNIGDAVVVTGQNVVKNGDPVTTLNQQARVQ
ncbi:MAG: efflux RND transporter periplasmic adaptor subunit [Candidatus Vecturithrix sp.]|jgi:RND family efflux transporter MFP subunit|nr:efflux RND transporter periplasmic adaptor subunit [Candidatus Vecturithrix sp.]